MFISIAQAQEAAAEISSETATLAADGPIDAPSAGNAFAWNMGLILVLVVMFYVLLIRPQQKRFAEHRAMVDALKKGDKVITSGGLVGKIDKVSGDEAVIDLGGTKVTAVRSTLQAHSDTTSKAANTAEKK